MDKNRNKIALEFLGNISSSSDLMKLGSSQQLASNWIINDDEFQLEIPASMEDSNADKFVSRYVLAVLYYALGGSRWRDKFNFFSGVDECFWNRVYTDTSTKAASLLGITCNKQLHPQAIMLRK